MSRVRALARPAPLLLTGLVLVGLALRVINNGYGLPYVFTHDEAGHFTDRAVEMFREGYDPGYYENPTTFTYVVHAALRFQFGLLGSFFDLPRGNVTDQFSADPTSIWISARTLTALLCTAGVVALYLVGRRLFGTREGLVAAAVLTFAFLAVTYSRQAVTDVGALTGVALALLLSIKALEDGRKRWFALAGGAAGLALSFKYTAGLVLLPVGLAALLRLRADRLRSVLGGVIAVVCAGVVFAVLNPYLILKFGEFRAKVQAQADVAGTLAKAGQEGSAPLYYLDSLTWGLGWAVALAVLAGVVVLARRDWRRALLLTAFPVALFVYLSLQSRYFGRWLLPAYPALALLAAVALVQAGDWLSRLRPRLAPLAVAALTALALAQMVAADVRSVVVLGREDTRLEARRYLERSFPPQLRISIEPAVPDRFYRAAPTGELPSWLKRCRPAGYSYRTAGGNRACELQEPGQFTRPASKVLSSNYHFVLTPRAVDDMRFYGYCTVMTLSLVRERVERIGSGKVREYYRRLERKADLVRVWSPYRKGAERPPFDFDLSYNYYPGAFSRPGPEIRLYRLRDCRQGVGPSAVRVPRTPKVPPGAAPEDA
ncbi:MAG: glycosyltransferase family 39 protein [Actinomycetota bacterium]|nr:glycosyltransferase family 39 protein [Actinomycetota bacterium]MDQ3648032.1 glycosyltransferase family 39 protein [Actinomycetota bacterium]